MEYRKVLIVDDSATSRMIIKRCFEMAGFMGAEFFEAEDGLKAVSFLQNNPVDLIVTDLKMPKMDGNTFIKKIKLQEMTKEIPVIVISSLSSDLLERQLYEEGVNIIIKKPISPAKILEGLGVEE